MKVLIWKIRELIQANRYLNPKEVEAYPQYLRDAELRRQRHALVDEFRSIIYDYNDFWEQVGDKEKKFDLYRMSGIWSSFGAGEKSARYAEGEVFALCSKPSVMSLVPLWVPVSSLASRTVFSRVGIPVSFLGYTTTS